MAKNFEKRLCDIFVKNKVISKKEAESLCAGFHGSSKESFDMFLLSEGIVPKEALLTALAEYYETPSFDVVGNLFRRELLTEFPQDILLRHAIIPLQRDDDFLIIVAHQPDNEDLLPVLAEFVSDDIQFYVGVHDDIVDAVMQFYGPSPFSDEDDTLDSEDDELYEDEELDEDIFNDEEDDDEDALFFS